MTSTLVSSGRLHIDEAKARLTIPALWQMFNLSGKPGKSCRSPFRDDRHASFSVSHDGRCFYDFATGEGGDAIDFLAKAKAIPVEQAFIDFLALAAVSSCPETNSKANKQSNPVTTKKLTLEELNPCSDNELEQISRVRRISIEGLVLAANRKLLFAYHHPHQGRCWIVTDSSHRNAICRRMDGQVFRQLDGSQGPKSRCWRGSEASWPIGAADAADFPAIALCEGGPDFWRHSGWSSRGSVEGSVMPVCMTSASVTIHTEALNLFAGKRVRIFGHHDKAGNEAVKRWARQLQGVRAQVDAFDFSGLKKADGAPVKDLNDFLEADHQRSGCPMGDLTGAFDFALEVAKS